MYKEIVDRLIELRKDFEDGVIHSPTVTKNMIQKKDGANYLLRVFSSDETHEPYSWITMTAPSREKIDFYVAYMTGLVNESLYYFIDLGGNIKGIYEVNLDEGIITPKQCEDGEGNQVLYDQITKGKDDMYQLASDGELYYLDEVRRIYNIVN